MVTSYKCREPGHIRCASTVFFSSLDGRKEAKEDQGVRDAGQFGRVPREYEKSGGQTGLLLLSTTSNYFSLPFTTSHYPFEIREERALHAADSLQIGAKRAVVDVGRRAVLADAPGVGGEASPLVADLGQAGG